MRLNKPIKSSSSSISIAATNYTEKMNPPAVTWEELRKEVNEEPQGPETQKTNPSCTGVFLLFRQEVSKIRLT
jgi:hypothetical protein